MAKHWCQSCTLTFWFPQNWFTCHLLWCVQLLRFQFPQNLIWFAHFKFLPFILDHEESSRIFLGASYIILTQIWSHLEFQTTLSTISCLGACLPLDSKHWQGTTCSFWNFGFIFSLNFSTIIYNKTTVKNWNT
jgi:hypothetical protein